MSTWNKVIHLFIHSYNINLCIYLFISFFERKTCITGLSKKHIVESFIITIAKSLVLVDGKYYQEINGVTKSTLIGTTLAKNVFVTMSRFILKPFPFNLNWLFWNENVNRKDTIFLIIFIWKHATKFFEYLNSQYLNIKFILEVFCDINF